MWFPAEEDILELHDRIIESTGGAHGILQPGGVRSAVERARYGPFDGDGDLAERAALILRGIVLDHPFADGNKRTAFAAADLFVRRNGKRIVASPDEVVAFMLAAARDEHGVAAIGTWIRARLRRL